MLKNVFILLMMSSLTSYAQVSKLMTFAIADLGIPSQNRQKALINYGRNFGFEPGQKGKIIGLYSQENPKHFAYLGEFELIEVYPDSSIALCVVNDTAQRPEIGDLIEIEIKVPNRYRGIFFNLAKYSICLVEEKNKQNYFYTISQIVLEESPEFENQLIDKLIKEIKQSSAIKEKNRPDSTISEGIYRGRRFYDLLFNPNRTDISRWLAYLPTDLKTFMGQCWYAPLNYRYWVTSGANFAWSSVKTALIEAQTEAQFDAVFNEFKPYFTTKIVEDWSEELIDGMDEMSNSEALAFADMLERLSRRLKVINVTGWSMFNRAKIYSRMLEYAKSNSEYRRSADYFTANDNSFYASYSLNNIAHNFKKSNQIDSAKHYYQKALEIKRSFKTHTSSLKSMLPTLFGLHEIELLQAKNDPKAALRAVEHLKERIEIYTKLKQEDQLPEAYMEIAKIFAKYLKDEKQALVYADEAKKINEKLAKPNATPKQIELLKATHYKNLAEIYVLLGDYNKVSQMHQSRYKLYLSYQDLEMQADALWDLAYNQSERLQQKTQSLQTYQEVLNLYTRLNQLSYKAVILRNTAIIHESLSQFEEAENRYTQAYQIREELAKKNPLDKATQLNLAKSYKDIAQRKAANGFYIEAAELHQRRIDIFQRYNDYNDLADAIWEKAYIIGSKLNRYAESNELYEKALKTFLGLGDKYSASTIKSNIAQNYWSLGEYEKAIQNHHQAIELANASGNSLRIAKSYGYLADLYKQTGDPNKGMQALNQAIQIYIQLDEQSLLAESYQSLAGFYKESKDWPTAIQFYKKAVEISEKNDFKQVSSDIYYEMGDCFYQFKNFAQAEIFYNKSLQTAKLAGTVTNQIYSLANLGLIKTVTNQYKEAEVFYNQAIEQAQQVDNKNILAYCRKQKASLEINKGKYEEAEKIYKEVLQYYSENSDKANQASLLASLADLSAVKGDYQQYENYVRTALDLATQINDRTQIANCNGYLAGLYMLKGEFDKALQMHRNSLETFAQVENLWGVAWSNLSLGNTYNLSGDYQMALKYYQISDSLYRSLNSLHSLATTSNNIGTIYYWQGDYQVALPMFEKAIAILDTLGVKDAFYYTLHTNKGEVFEAQKEFKKAEEMLSFALKGAKQIGDKTEIGSINISLGRIKRQQNDLAAAEKLFLEAFDIYSKTPIKSSLASVASELGINYYLKKDFKSAQQFLQIAIDTAKKYKLSRYLWEALYHKALIARSQNQSEQAKILLIEAISALEDIQSKMSGGEAAKKIFSSGEKKLKIYQALVDVLIEKGEVDLALQYLERSNSEDLRTKFKSLEIKFSDKDKNEALEKERELKRKLDNLETELSKLKNASQTSTNKIEELEKIRTVAEGEYVQFVNKTIISQPALKQHLSRSVNPLEMRNERKKNRIPKNLAVLSFLPGDESLYIFLATSDTVVAKVVPVSREELWRNIQYLHNVASNGMKGISTDVLRVARGKNNSNQIPTNFNTNQSQYKKIAEKLYDLVIMPIEEHIFQKEIVAIVPNGPFHFLPFQMLGKTQTNRKFDYLIEHHTLFYTHSLEMLDTDKIPSKDLKIVAFANADNTLPATENEVAQIKKLYPNSTVFIREDATEQKVKSQITGNNVLHLATHGNLDYFEFESSFLTLAASGVEDGMLTINEVWGLEGLHGYNLVTLSACQTAVSEGALEGWPVSPATSFLDAGVPTVLASLWSVNDEATSLLMSYFYENLKTMSKVEALRMAQIRLAEQEQYSHPYFWAPFILIGDWR
jgi:CHAT domain-containing protein/Tfp pilus assembly protein PilF